MLISKNELVLVIDYHLNEELQENRLSRKTNNRGESILHFFLL